jgi:hypothetical protein
MLCGLGLFFSRSMFRPVEELSNSCPPSEPQRLNDFIGDTVFPPSTHNLWTDCKSFVGFIAQVRFEIDPRELNLFVQTTKVVLPLAVTGKPESLGFLDNALNDTINQIDSYLYGHYANHDWVEELLIDTTNPENYVVYYMVRAG